MKISLKFIHKGLIDNISTLVQIMASGQTGAKPLSEPMLIILLMHICITWLQWVNTGRAEFILGETSNIFLIFYNFWALRWYRYLKSLLMEDMDSFNFYNQYHGCWGPDDARSQGISSHGIELVILEWWTPSHYLNQCCNIVNGTPRNKLQLNCNRSSYIFILENPFQNVVWKTVAILSLPQMS